MSEEAIVKKSYFSKTLILNFVIGAVSMFYPPAAEWIQSHPTEVMSGFAVINIILRIVTKSKVQLW